MEEQNGTTESGFTGEQGSSAGLTGASGKSALICTTDQAMRDKIGSVLQDLGYAVTFPKSAKDAIDAMSFHVFDVVVLDELFGTEISGKNELYAYLSAQNMAMRRRFFVALVGKDFTTADYILPTLCNVSKKTW